MLLRRFIDHVKHQEWTAIAIDFAVVVTGILIAFQITTWNETRQERVREQLYLTRIASELDNTIEEIEHSILITNERQELGEFLLRTVTDPDLVRTDPEHFLVALVIGGYTFSPNVRAQTFDEMRSAGDLNILRDTQLRFDLTEFYTSIRGFSQWDYLRELRQTEYVRRSAGILTYDQLQAVTAYYNNPAATGPLETSEDGAMQAYERMIARQDFIDWLPTVTVRADDVEAYAGWLEGARSLRARLDVPAAPVQEGTSGK